MIKTGDLIKTQMGVKKVIKINGFGGYTTKHYHVPSMGESGHRKANLIERVIYKLITRD